MTNGDATALPSADPGPDPVLTKEDIAEDAKRRAETYSQGDHHGVAVVDGFGARVVVERGHLELHDGVGPDRRVRRYPKIDPPRRVAIGVGTEGVVSLDALRWCSQVGTALVALSNDGAILAAGPPAREDARLLRAQALALYGPVGLAVTRYLIGEKVKGQSQLVLLDLDEREASEVLHDLYSEIERADSIEAVRQLEAAAANVYFAAWERKVEATFVRKDLHRIPTHWSRFNGRRSSVNPGTARSATDPTGAVLNYSYKLAEIEASMAARRMGLDPGIGILHADFPGRPSFACDLMEAVRPAVDRHVLDVLFGPLLKREFTEDARGVVRCLAPLTHRLAEAMPAYGVALGPVVEHVAELLAQSSPYDVSVPSVLSGSKHKAAARKRSGTSSGPVRDRGPNAGSLPPRGRRRRKPSPQPPLPFRACRGCGGHLPIDSDRDAPRIDWCAECIRGRRRELGEAMPETARVAALRIAEETGHLPTHSPAASEARSSANARQREAQKQWNESDGAELDLAWYEREILPRLSALTLPMIARATGASTSAASQWRSGKRVPHRRHWQKLAECLDHMMLTDH